GGIGFEAEDEIAAFVGQRYRMGFEHESVPLQPPIALLLIAVRRMPLPLQNLATDMVVAGDVALPAVGDGLPVLQHEPVGAAEALVAPAEERIRRQTVARQD